MSQSGHHDTSQKMQKRTRTSDCWCIEKCIEFRFGIPYMGSVPGHAAGDESVKQVSCQSEQQGVSIPAAAELKQIKIEAENGGIFD